MTSDELTDPKLAARRAARRRFWIVVCDALAAMSRLLRCWQVGDCPPE